MFTATSYSGRTVSLLNNADRAYIEANDGWYCQVCKEHLQLKKGRKRRPHFAHHPNTACPTSNPESERHLEGKALLYRWLKAQGAEVHVEAFLPESNQRADLLVKNKNDTIAVEYQCSTVDREQIRRRTALYHSIGVQVLWVMPYDHLRRKGSVVYLKEWQWEAAYLGHSSELRDTYLQRMPALFYFQPPSLFWTAHLNAYLSPKKAHARFIAHRLPPSTLECVRTPATVPREMQRSALLIYKKETRYGKRPPSTPFSTIVQAQLLRDKIPIHLHPPEAGWFLPGQPWVNESPVLWQSWLFLHILSHFNRQTFISLQTLGTAKQWLSTYLHLPVTRARILMDEYLRLLVRLRVLMLHADDTFTLMQMPRWPQSPDEGFAMDQQYAERLCAVNDSVAPRTYFPL
ncbi:competence protein CoiA [Salicibibacter kimchii]|uniref:Competence protein CoiA n=1 Tax=Salicibibacter kimchii TaxID=2099786 RepID=A0A345BXJ1_9BACI|nr:competence protein CoiA family protein [Salicibibacter kimchii]AXF55672.1 hypothetical protein DT065_06310 [Salicibibacter kimchii]